MPTLQIELSCPYEVTENEWRDILSRIQHNILRGDYETVSARIVCGLTPRAADLPPAASLVESNAKAANR